MYCDKWKVQHDTAAAASASVVSDIYIFGHQHQHQPDLGPDIARRSRLPVRHRHVAEVALLHGKWPFLPDMWLFCNLISGGYLVNQLSAAISLHVKSTIWFWWRSAFNNITMPRIPTRSRTSSQDAGRAASWRVTQPGMGEFVFPETLKRMSNWNQPETKDCW